MTIRMPPDIYRIKGAMEILGPAHIHSMARSFRIYSPRDIPDRVLMHISNAETIEPRCLRVHAPRVGKADRIRRDVEDEFRHSPNAVPRIGCRLRLPLASAAPGTNAL